MVIYLHYYTTLTHMIVYNTQSCLYLHMYYLCLLVGGRLNGMHYQVNKESDVHASIII